MEPSPPRKPRRLPSHQQQAFYEKREAKKTSAEIVSEARLEMQLNDRERVRALRTSRPYTPLTDHRTLFSKSQRGSSISSERPPSSFSLGSRHFESGESRPVSGTALPPIEHRLVFLPGSPDLVIPRPPPDPNRKLSSRSGSRPQVQRNSSLDGRQEDGLRTRRGSLDDSVHDFQNLARRAHSGPTERTALAQGEGEISSDFSPPKLQLDTYPRPCYSADPGSRTSGLAELLTWPPESIPSDSESASYYEECIRPILDILADTRRSADVAATSCAQLYDALAARDLLGKACAQRSHILRTTFKLLDRDDARLLLQVARVILALRVSGSNLTSICKLVFKLSKDDNNDKHFLTDNVIDLLLKATASIELVAGADALVYSLGSIKILAGSARVVTQLVQNGAVVTLLGLLDKIISLENTADKPMEKLAQTLVQLTGALRHVAPLPEAKEQFMAHNAVSKLCSVLYSFSTDYDIALNISSIFSKLTVHADCCTVLAKDANSFKAILKALKEHTAKEETVVRLCFVLGNVAARSEEARRATHDEQDSIEVVMAVFDHYVDILLKESQSKSKATSPSKVHDVLVKTIRVIANLSIDEGIGVELTSPRWKCSQQLLHVLEVCDVEASEELMLNTMATINNLSYYASSKSSAGGYSLSLAKALLKLLLTNSEPGMIEACRIYGNLTRQRHVRDFLARNSVPEIMVTLLDSGSRELVYSCCGVLINFMLDDDKRAILKKESGIRKLVEVLRDFGADDWQLSALVCQVLWNYSTKILSCNATFGEEETALLAKLLAEYLGAECWPSLVSRDSNDVAQHMRWIWETEFCPVAQKLLHRVECNQSQFDTLDP